MYARVSRISQALPKVDFSRVGVYGGNVGVAVMPYILVIKKE